MKLIRADFWKRQKKKPNHRSFFEDDNVADLKKRKIAYEYEPETFDYRGRVGNARCTDCGGSHVYIRRRYTPDLKIASYYVELKGKFTPTTRARMEDFLKSHPGFDLRFVFQRDNWTTATRRERYSGWAERHGCKWAIGLVPESWVTSVESG